ncbi:carotenoid oxygenase family protein [Rhabdothermincola salaria]|uniref:carotenoid oxygenase family protein n=1 Tax=Rhabdothermincola salaria TaxID=2903142 RepID=UPI001E503A0B|nr:carotenoid oxygenase family protein [Rhabdothermincola salaria]MCD9622822.1 carotenoid oxygenase family protein [Rhabdothermincola salaria]
MPDLEPVDPTTNAHLRGRFAPTHSEITVEGLEVEGTLPEGLVGAYLRNGPNPKFTPLGSYTFPMEGDAMVHGTWIEADGTIRYRNRWVRSKGMAAEERAGKALFGGLMTPAFVDPSLLGNDPDPGWPFKLDPFINVVRHAGRHLALTESAPGYEITSDLDTIGRFDFDGRVKGMCAHPRIDPVTGDMVLFTYDVEAPFLSWMTIGANGDLTRGPTVIDGVDEGYMVHDCVITERYLVLTLAPVVFDLDAMMTGGDVLAWKPDLGTRIACIPRDGSPVQWVHTDPFFVWHFGNGFDLGDDVVMDFSWWSSFSLGPDPDKRGAFARATLHPSAGTAEIEHVEDVPGEFGRIDDRRTGREHRYVTVSRKSPRGGDLVPGEFDQLARYDMATGECKAYDSDLVFGEVVFAPRQGGTDELDGFYVTYGTDRAAESSWLVIWDAASFPADPVAKVRMPQRIPNGLHGNWLPAEG